MADEYFIIPFTGQRVYDGTVVIIQRLPSLKFIARNGYYEYDGEAKEGWHLVDVGDSSIMPLFRGDLNGMIIDGEPYPPGPIGPIPPHPHPGPGPSPRPPYPPFPPGPGPTPLTPSDRAVLNSAMITVPTLADRDRLDSNWLIDGRVVRVNNSGGKLAYYQWNAKTLSWEDFDLGDKFMNRAQIEEALSPLVKKIDYNREGSVVVTMQNGVEEIVDLVGATVNAEYDESTSTLTLPIVGGDTLTVSDEVVASAEFNKHQELPSGETCQALIIDLTKGEDSRKIVADMTPILPGWEPYKPN